MSEIINNDEVIEEIIEYEEAPSTFTILWREIYHDKLALVSLVTLILLIASVFIAANFFSLDTSKKVNLRLINKPPKPVEFFKGEENAFLLGTDKSGRDMVPQLILGARNSLAIAFSVTILCAVAGILIGLLAGFYGGAVDNIIMRIIDFLSMLPFLMIIIVLVSMIPKYNVITFVLIMSSLGWLGKARLIRAKTLQQSNLDYVSASKTLGSPNIIIMFREVLPNILGIIVVNFTLNLSVNIGMETGLTYLGFGLPFNTPSLGTLISNAAVIETLRDRPWQWLPAALLIIVMMLCINFVGQAVSRASDAKQRI